MAVFHATHGHGPWSCYFCGSTVTIIGKDTWDGNVHHVDGDESYDVPENVVMTHTICHQQHHSPTDEQKQQISAKLKGRVSPTLGMKFPNRKPLPWQKSSNASRKSRAPHPRSDNVGEHNLFYGKKHTQESISKMRQPRDKLLCEDCGETWAKNWIKRHKQDGKCTERRVIEIDGVQRVRGTLPKTLCPDCGEPYADRWVQRHKNEGRCLRKSVGQRD